MGAVFIQTTTEGSLSEIHSEEAWVLGQLFSPSIHGFRLPYHRLGVPFLFSFSLFLRSRTQGPSPGSVCLFTHRSLQRGRDLVTALTFGKATVMPVSTFSTLSLCHLHIYPPGMPPPHPLCFLALDIEHRLVLCARQALGHEAIYHWLPLHCFRDSVLLCYPGWP